MKLLFPLLSIILFVAASCMHESIEPPGYSADEAEAFKFYENQLQNIIKEKCLSCHDYHQNGASYYDSFLKVKNAAGHISERVFSGEERLRMPPSGGDSLTDEELDLFSEFLELLNYKEMEKRTEDKIQITWIGYKYPENRVGVAGSFDEISVFSLKDYNPEAPLQFLENGKFSIPTGSANIGNDSLRTDNICNYFFRYMAPDIEGEVLRIENDTITVNINMNFITRPIDFYIESLDDTALVLAGRIEDMNVFNWKLAHDNLGRVCGQFHRGYLWEDVDLKFEYKFK